MLLCKKRSLFILALVILAPVFNLSCASRISLQREELGEAMAIMNKVAKKIHATQVRSDAKIVKISIVGAGMRSHSGVAAQIFKTLSAHKVNILMISTGS